LVPVGNRARTLTRGPIEAALERKAKIDASRIIVEADDNEVTPRDSVRSWLESRRGCSGRMAVAWRTKRRQPYHRRRTCSGVVVIWLAASHARSCKKYQCGRIFDRNPCGTRVISARVLSPFVSRHASAEPTPHTKGKHSTSPARVNSRTIIGLVTKFRTTTSKRFC
jgi:hypothetical protein